MSTAAQPDVSTAAQSQVSAPAQSPRELLTVGPLEILPDDNIAVASGRTLMLSIREFRLVWGREMRAGDRSVDVYVRKLRVKLEQALPEWRFIHTHFGFGYRLSAER